MLSMAFWYTSRGLDERVKIGIFFIGLGIDHGRFRVRFTHDFLGGLIRLGRDFLELFVAVSFDHTRFTFPFRTKLLGNLFPLGDHALVD